MNSESSDVSGAAASGVNLQPKKKISCGLIAVVAILLLLVTCAGAYWWYNRPITPVELSAKEKQVVEEKVGSIEAAPGEPEYERGSKEIVLTERELNGLINQNTSLGDKLKLTLATGEVHARLETDLDEDLPVVGGKKLKAKARFLVGSVEGRPSLVLDDITVWGASLPNDWLGGLKGQDLLGQIFGGGGGVSGIAELRIERGQLVIKLAE
ncbi:MAG: hypothetical protein NWT08_09240 [Akkermansiaceae bacterium]|jgi:hypothetical protein|nr:hypothetical protein [Akkermansiaceae bacterium]MDP4646962.1 hypothetical protein [Akkermansiaceae bacterium]MDP4720615.1 hypothetical protein [Akkermansiaceae bacterium]MDP4780193.1 hypothetical protein [Akkermansiaceae bacterium]MDP4847559.1 hypothetical protein [Akkermansiaceae bacterium]